MRRCHAQEARTATVESRGFLSPILHHAHGSAVRVRRSSAIRDIAAKCHAPTNIVPRTKTDDRSPRNRRARTYSHSHTSTARAAASMVRIGVSSYSSDGPFCTDANHSGQTTILCVWATSLRSAAASTSCVHSHHWRVQSSPQDRSHAAWDG